MVRSFDKSVRQLIENAGSILGYDKSTEIPDDFSWDEFDSAYGPANEMDEGTGLVRLSYKAVKGALIDCYINRNALMIYGDPGIGKSEVVRNVCKDMFAPNENREYVNWHASDDAKKDEVLKDPGKYYVLLDVRSAELEPVDLRGIEMPHSNSAYLDPKIPREIWLMSRSDSSGLLFLDELNQAVPQVLNSMFGVVLDKKAGNVKFSDNWTIAAASNIGAEHSTTQELPPALSQRFGTCMLVADPEGWIEWAEDAGINRLITAFIKAAPEKNFYVKSDSSAVSMPNPRNLVKFNGQLLTIQRKYQEAKNRGIKLPEPISENVLREASLTCGPIWGRAFVNFMRIFSKLQWDTMHGTKEQYKDMKIDDKYAYMLFISDHLYARFRKDAPFNAKYNVALTKHQQGKPLDATDKEVIQDGTKTVLQFAKIMLNLMHNEEEMVATMCNMLNQRDSDILVNVLSILSHFSDSHQEMKDVQKKIVQAIQLGRMR